VIRDFRAARDLPQQALLPRGYGNCLEFEAIDPLAMDNVSGSDDSDNADEAHLDEQDADSDVKVATVAVSSGR
jgi:hypothetical protein